MAEQYLPWPTSPIQLAKEILNNLTLTKPANSEIAALIWEVTFKEKTKYLHWTGQFSEGTC